VLWLGLHFGVDFTVGFWDCSACFGDAKGDCGEGEAGFVEEDMGC
jgi:hypothetical protein